MSTGRPPAPEVASISTSASPAPAGRATGTITPVEVSLCAQATTSAPPVARPAADRGRVGRVAGVGRDDDRVLEERRAGGDVGELLRELAVGQVQRARAATRPNAAASQKAVAPPLPSATS